MNSTVTYDDILKEIDRLDGENPEGWSAMDLSRASGIHVQRVRENIGSLIMAQKVRCNGRARRISIDGAMRWVPVYVYIKAKGGK